MKTGGDRLGYHARLLRQEMGAIEQKKGALVKAVCVYPNTYSVGMANMGFQTVYRYFNRHWGVRCERAFYEHSFRNSPVLSLESSTPISKFDVVGFSLSFELDVINVIRSLFLSHIPVLSKDRTEFDPVVICGGPVAGLNPFPLLPFMDGLLAGDGEEVFDELCDVFTEAREQRLKRKDAIERLAGVTGMLIPGITRTVKRQVLKDLDSHPSYTHVVTPNSHFRNMFVVEVSRGCPRRCGFCTARSLYHPFRYRSIDTILHTIDAYNPGAGRAGLEGSAVSDYPGLEQLCTKVLDRGLDISFSSIRADRISGNMQKIINESGLKTFTMAPEAGSQSLRDRIGKQLSDEEIVTGAQRLASTSVKVLKLYFMIGLPGENDSDVAEIAKLSGRIASVFGSNRAGRTVRLSINTFIPKPMTPFACEPLITEKQINRKRAVIRSEIAKTEGIELSKRSSREEVLQGLISLGTAETGLGLMDSIVTNMPWKRAVQKRGIDLEHVLFSEKDQSWFEPWQIFE